MLNLVTFSWANHFGLGEPMPLQQAQTWTLECLMEARLL